MLAEIVAWSLILVLVSSAWLNFSGPSYVVEEFTHWGYPHWLRFAVGATELASAALLVMPATRPAGALIALLVLGGVVFSLFKTREWLRMEFPLLMAALCIGLVL